MHGRGAFLAGQSDVILFPFGILILLVTLLGLASSAQPAVLKSVQTGTATIAGTSASATATLSPAVDTTKAFLVFGVSENTGDPQYGQISGRITNSTTVTFQRYAATGAATVKWYVAEFTSGVAVQRGTSSALNGISSLDIPIQLGGNSERKTLARSLPA